MISRELHDTLAQDLAYLKVALRSLGSQGGSGPGVHERIQGLCDVVDRDIARVRDLSYDLGTPGLARRGIVHALSHYCREFSERTGLTVEFDAFGMDETKVDPGMATNLYRLVQEGLNNILKHAQAKCAFVRLAGSFPNVILRIMDDGQGFDVEKRLRTLTEEKRMGLRSMQERVKLLGGKMMLRSRIGAGTEISMEIPYEEATRGVEKNHPHR
jgi:signal transduction histidine kinase